MALSTEYLLRAGPFDIEGQRVADSDEAAKAIVAEKYSNFTKATPERLVTCSDDFTMILWNPVCSKELICRMTGHQQLVNHVLFSPDGQFIASASFDKSVKLWHSASGKFVANLRVHAASVYQLAFSGDSRLLVSAAKDSTLKLWEVKTKRLLANLPGHADEVYAVDWSLGRDSKCVSGGKDRTIRFWRQ
jgi:ribosome assembly protein 4